MDILLTHGYFLFEDPHELAVMKPYPPLGLLYISSHLKARGFDVALYDTTFSSWEDFETYARTARPPVVGIYTNLMTKQNVLRMVGLFKQIGATVILGGPEPAPYAEQYLRHGADIVVVGEGESTLAELIPHLARHGMAGLEQIPGIAFLTAPDEGLPGAASEGFARDEGGVLDPPSPPRGGIERGVLHTPPRAQIRDLSSQPWPDREAIDLERYLETWRRHHGVRSLSLITARGCPYTCTWCSHSVFGNTHRRREVEEVADEVAYLAERYRPDQLWYADDVFTINRRWTLQYADELERRGLRLPFECISRADRLDEEVADALAAMGCRRLWIGSESGSQRILDAMKRKADVTDVQAKTRLLQARGIEVGMFIMLGYEGEEVADIEATVDHLKVANPDLFLTTVAYPIKGTPYHDAVADRVYSTLDWAARTDRDLGVTGRHSRRFYDHATRWMVSAVNLHKLRRAGSRDVARLTRLAINAGRGRLGMRLTRGEREQADGANAAGRGWPQQDRATDGW